MRRLSDLLPPRRETFVVIDGSTKIRVTVRPVPAQLNRRAAGHFKTARMLSREAHRLEWQILHAAHAIADDHDPRLDEGLRYRLLDLTERRGSMLAFAKAHLAMGDRLLDRCGQRLACCDE